MDFISWMEKNSDLKSLEMIENRRGGFHVMKDDIVCEMRRNNRNNFQL